MNQTEAKLLAAAKLIIARFKVSATLEAPPSYNAETNVSSAGQSVAVTSSPIIDKARQAGGDGDAQSTAKAYVAGDGPAPAVGGYFTAGGRRMAIVSTRRLSAGENVQAWEVGLADA